MAKRAQRPYVLIAILLCLAGAVTCPGQDTPNNATEKPVAIKVLEVGVTSRRTFVEAIRNLSLWYDCDVQIYVINYGSDREIARRERHIRNSMPKLRVFDCSRRTLVRGGLGQGPNTVIWKVPPGAEYPAP
jgi:putative aminopeptidase FrvX